MNEMIVLERLLWLVLRTRRWSSNVAGYHSSRNLPNIPNLNMSRVSKRTGIEAAADVLSFSLLETGLLREELVTQRRFVYTNMRSVGDF